MGLNLKDILDNFAFIGQYLEHEAFGSGHIHHTYKFTFEELGKTKSYLVQKMNTQVFKQPQILMKNIEQVSQHLQKKYQRLPDSGRRCLKLILSKDQKSFYQNASGDYWRVFDFIENTYSLDSVENPQQAYQAAKAFATFTKDLMDLPVHQFQATIPNFHHIGQRYQNFLLAERKASDQRIHRATATFPLNAQNKENLLYFMHQKAKWVSEVEAITKLLPARLIHNDTKVNNVLLDRTTDEGICIVDLDTVMPGYLLYDFGDMVRSSVSPLPEDVSHRDLVQVRKPIFEALVKGYLEVLGDYMNHQEKACLFLGAKLMTFIMALRFLTDFLEGDIYYKIKHPLHNLDRAINQVQLLLALEAQEGKLQRIIANHA